MQVVLLAAGLGSRLGALTTSHPKALISVGGEPLLAHALQFAARLTPDHVIVVSGYQHQQVATELARLAPAGPVALAFNPRFREGNLLSLMAARPHLTEDDLLLLNVDHIFHPAIADIVRPPIDEITAFIDTDRVLGADDMKVERDAAGRIRHISKTLATWDAGYVGMTRIPRSALARYFTVADAALASLGSAIHVESVLSALAESGQPPACRDISSCGWWEVDTPEERDRADAALRPSGGTEP